MERIKLNNEEAEIRVIGALVLNNSLIDKVNRILRADDFYSIIYKKLYEIIIKMNNELKQIESYSLHEEMMKDKVWVNKSKLIMMALNEAIENVTVSSNVEYYAEIVKEMSIKRKIMLMSEDILKKVYEVNESSKNIIEYADKLLFEVHSENKNFNLENLTTFLVKYVDELQKGEGRTYRTGISTGYKDLDYYLGGLRAGEIIILGARPSLGKTTLALNIAYNIMAKNKDLSVGFFSLEMPSETLAERLISTHSRIDAQHIRDIRFDKNEKLRIVEAISGLSEFKLYIDSTASLSLLELKAQARMMKKEQGIDVLFIDYIGLITLDNSKNIPRHEQVSEISRSLKALARELNIPVVVLSQVSREVESQNKKPTLAHLRESGSVEQDADVVIFIHRDRQDDRKKNMSEYTDDNLSVVDEGGNMGVKTEIIVAKNRNGRTGECFLYFEQQYVKFTSMENDYHKG